MVDDKKEVVMKKLMMSVVVLISISHLLKPNSLNPNFYLAYQIELWNEYLARYSSKNDAKFYKFLNINHWNQLPVNTEFLIKEKIQIAEDKPVSSQGNMFSKRNLWAHLPNNLFRIRRKEDYYTKNVESI